MKNAYEVRGETTVIFIFSNESVYEIIIDTDDLDKVKEFRNSFCLNGGGYVQGRTNENKKATYTMLHRLILDFPDGFDVDHINHNKLDNRKSNLREVTRQENVCNATGARSHNTTSQHLGVSWNRRIQKWVVQVRVKGKVSFKKLFDLGELEEAKRVADQARAYYMHTSKDAREINDPNIDDYIKTPDSPWNTNKTSGYRNVCWRKDLKMWVVVVKRKHFGNFENLSEAVEQAKKAREMMKKSS